MGPAGSRRFWLTLSTLPRPAFNTAGRRRPYAATTAPAIRRAIVSVSGASRSARRPAGPACVWVAATRMFAGGMPVAVPAISRTSATSRRSTPIRSHETSATCVVPSSATSARAWRSSCTPTEPLWRASYPSRYVPMGGVITTSAVPARRVILAFPGRGASVPSGPLPDYRATYRDRGPATDSILSAAPRYPGRCRARPIILLVAISRDRLGPF